MYGPIEGEKIDRTILQKTSGLYEIKLLRQHDSRGQVPLVGNGDKQLGYVSLGEHRRKWSRERDMRCAATVFQCFNDSQVEAFGRKACQSLERRLLGGKLAGEDLSRIMP